MGKTTVIEFIPDPNAFAKAYAEFIKRKKERGEECSQFYILVMIVKVPRFLWNRDGNVQYARNRSVNNRGMAGSNKGGYQKWV